jgi:hypothetical protein
MFEAPTRSQYANKADFDVANAEYTARRRRCNDLAFKAFERQEADYAFLRSKVVVINVK